MMEPVDVSQADVALAARVIPAEVIFADAEDHVADLRQRAAQMIAKFRLQHTAGMIAKLEGMKDEPMLGLSMEAMRRHGRNAILDEAIASLSVLGEGS